MQNITITMDPQVAQWARIWAARHNTSVSRMLGEMLATKMREEDEYDLAMQGYLAGQRNAAFPAQAETENVGDADRARRSGAQRFGERDDWHAR